MKTTGLGKIADYKFPTTVDGYGIRGAIYVSGCTFNCDGCYNKSIQNFRNGEDFTDELKQTILSDMTKDYVDGLTLLGGDPFLNTATVTPLAREVKELGKTVWSWTGFTLEELLEGSTDQLELLSYVDVLVDGRFDRTKFNPNLVFRGSYNQRIIDVKLSLAQNKVCLWNDGAYEKEEEHISVPLP